MDTLPPEMLLKQIVDYKKLELSRTQDKNPLSMIMKRLGEAAPPRPFAPALHRVGEVSIIAEIKRASPSKGLLCSAYSPRELAEFYQAGGARAVSVITESRFFQGSTAILPEIREATGLPLLRKDFLFSEYQVFESRALGADAILLIVSMLGERMLTRLLKLAADLGMDALVEVHDREELRQALAAGAALVGVNNRNLKTFEVDLAVTRQLAGEVPPGVTLVSESGIKGPGDMKNLEHWGADAALIGETLVTAGDPASKLRELRGLV